MNIFPINYEETVVNRTLDMYSPFTMNAQSGTTSGLDKSHFSKYWKVESMNLLTIKFPFQGDTCEILSPKGLTLWRKRKNVGQRHHWIRCLCGSRRETRWQTKRLKLLLDGFRPESFWHLETHELAKRVFVNCYSLQLYYLGYGGNYNSTTRFAVMTAMKPG